MHRRSFLTLLGTSAAAWPVAARAQQRPRIPIIGYLQAGARGPAIHQIAAFHKGLNEGGYVENRNVAIAYRFAEGHYERLPRLAAELVSYGVDVILAAGGGRPGTAAKAATSTIPVVFISGDTDPVYEGLVTSLNRPTGNLTGVSSLLSALTGKRLGLLHDLVPKASTIAMLANPDTLSVNSQIAEARKAAETIGALLHIFDARSESDFGPMFAAMVQRRVGACLVSADAFYGTNRRQLVELAQRNAIPAMYYRREFVDEGGLISYAAPLTETYRQAGVYVARILNGTKPADLPVVQPTKFELVINRRTANALRLEIPPTLLALADEVIE
jgi:putative ABC transport system substrate-binding protein